jgi:hypothetical protein
VYIKVRVSQRIIYDAEAALIIVFLKQADQAAFKLIAHLLFPSFHISICTPAIPTGNELAKNRGYTHRAGVCRPFVRMPAA